MSGKSGGRLEVFFLDRNLEGIESSTRNLGLGRISFRHRFLYFPRRGGPSRRKAKPSTTTATASRSWPWTASAWTRCWCRRWD